MKKLMVAGLVACAAVFAKADVEWNWWLNNPTAKPDISLGIASKCAEVKTFEASFFYSASPVKDGFQFTFLGLNNSDSVCPLQLAFFNRGKDPCLQLGFINVGNSSCVQLGCGNISKASTFDLGFLNFSDNAKFQLGFLNFNKKGFLPVFIIVNFNPEIFK